MNPLKTSFFLWMERIFITKEIPKSEFSYKNAKVFFNEDCTKEMLDEYVKEFKRGLFKKTNLKATRIKSNMYDDTIKEVLNVAKNIKVASGKTEDGRIDSAMKETPFLNELKKQLLDSHPTWDILISPPRASCDIMVNSIRINLKLTDCKTADNSVNKPSIYYSITGLTTYPYSSNWNEFLEKLNEAKSQGKIKKIRDRSTEYHYLVKNKINGDTLLKPIFDIHTFVSNPSNDLQINWKNEFINIDYTATDYINKVHTLLLCIQKSVKDMIEKTRKFAETDFKDILN